MREHHADHGERQSDLLGGLTVVATAILAVALLLVWSAGDLTAGPWQGPDVCSEHSEFEAAGHLVML